jgi:hypothetical protein
LSITLSSFHKPTSGDLMLAAIAGTTRLNDAATANAQSDVRMMPPKV